MRTVIAAIVAALLLAAPTHAQDARHGIDHARAAGMTVDPAAEQLMARAPIGTCANDPTLPKCPPAHAVVFSGRASYAAGVAPIAAAATQGKRPVAHAAQIDQCRVRVTDQSPYKAVGLAQMDAQNYCSTAVTTHELYGVLRKYYNGQWYAMASRYKSGGIPGKTLYLNVRYDCTATPYRAWEARADGYSLMRGVWYAGTQSRFNNLYCG